MPSPDYSFYNIKRLHVVFAASSATLLAVTLWMLAADHGRPWKTYQRTWRDQVEPWLTESQLHQKESEPDSPAHRSAINRLERTLHQQRPTWGRRLLELPMLDALGRPLSIQQIWLPNLEINYNFRGVARFDRCTTCHMGVDKTLPGTTSEPACLPHQRLALELPRPTGGPDKGLRSVAGLYGLVLADTGILDPKAPTVGLVTPRSPGAIAGLMVGDVLVRIDGKPLADKTDAQKYLLDAAMPEGSDKVVPRTIRLEIQRGLPQPYSSHPRLDLYLGSASPHPMGEFGCTICHDGQGSATAFTFASHTPGDVAQRRRWKASYDWAPDRCWDFPMRSARFLESSCLRCHHDVTDLEPSPRFPDPPAPKLLEGYHLVRRLGCFGCHEIKGVQPSGERVGPDLRLEPNDSEAALDHANPGTMRKVGPSLHEVASKLDSEVLATWIARPGDFRPDTRMPQAFGLHEHLQGQTLDRTRRMEAVEVRGVTDYLAAASQPMPSLESPPQAVEPPSAERGKRLFLVKGCAACHQHEDYPDASSVQGPTLTRLGTKITTESGRRWLASWIRNPSRHWPRTRMPNTLLEPIRLDGGQDPTNKPRWSDPAADLAAWLLQSKAPRPVAQPTPNEKDIDELVLGYLEKTYPEKLARQYLAEGIPAAVADEVSPDSRELLAPIDRQKKLRYIGRRAIRKRGCFGCHDIPGFSDAQPIGPALSEWGRKPSSLLAFGQVHALVTNEHQAEEARRMSKSAGTRPGSSTASASNEATQDDWGYYLDAIGQQRREGFLWQKLRAPRSFDYKAADNKPYNEQLLMGRFSLTAAQREAIATFVLGLVAEPPRARYVNHPERRRQAIVDGRKMLDQYGCAECHTLQMERWKFTYDPGKFEVPAAAPAFAWTRPSLTPAALAQSQRTDRCGQGQAEVVGMPRVDAQGKLITDEDDDGRPLHYFMLWEPAAIHGQVWPVGGAEVPISASRIVQKQAAWGGALARLLYPRLLQEAKAAGMGVPDVEGWGWVPPALVHEGAAVKPAWLYDYLLNPQPIRPAVVLRMPQYNLSPQDASKLVDYFAAACGVDFPYSASPGRSETSNSSGDPKQRDRQDGAMRLVTDRITYCAKCHQIGDYRPGGDLQTVLAPNLDRVGQRIRPEYLRRWLANPKSVVPYTGMPVNFPPEGPPMGQDLLSGTSLEQLDAVYELLVNYDGYVKQRVSIKRMIDQAGVPAGQ